MLKGQTSIELGIIMAFLLVVLIALLNTSLGNNSQLNEYKRQLSADSIGEDLVSNINNVYLSGNGASKTVILPSMLDPNEAYNISISGRNIEIKWAKKRHLETAITSGINSTNISGGQTISITNQEGRIIIG